MATLSGMTAGSGASSWQNVIRQRLEERDARERAFDEVVDNYQRLARFAKQQRDRNTALLSAAGAISTTKDVTTTSRPSTAGESSTTPKEGSKVDPSAIKQAYIQSLEGQVQTLRDELATLHKTQSQDAQKLLILNEQVRVKDDKERRQDDEVRRLSDELIKLKRTVEDLRSVVGEKDKMIQMQQDELSALSLELNQVVLQNDDYKRDNANLLQRWLDHMNNEAERMNDGNRFLEEVEKRRADRSSGGDDTIVATRTTPTGKGKGKEVSRGES